MNTIYEFEANNRSYVVKVCTNEKNEIGWFRAEPEIYRMISEKTSVPSPNVIFKDFSEERCENCFYVMEKLPGKNPDKIKQELSRETLGKIIYQYGEILGEIHNSTSFDHYGLLEADENGHLETEDDAEKWGRSLEGKIDAWKDIIQEDWENPIEIDTPKQAIREKVPEDPGATLIHSDNRLDNLLIQNDRITGFIDWSHPATGHNEYDLARAEYLLIDWDLSQKNKEVKDYCRKKLYEGYQETNTIKEGFDDRKQVYRYATAVWLAAGFANWGNQFDEVKHREMREEIIERIEEESNK